MMYLIIILGMFLGLGISCAILAEDDEVNMEVLVWIARDPSRARLAKAWLNYLLQAEGLTSAKVESASENCPVKRRLLPLLVPHSKERYRDVLAQIEMATR